MTQPCGPSPARHKCATWALKKLYCVREMRDNECECQLSAAVAIFISVRFTTAVPAPFRASDLGGQSCGRQERNRLIWSAAAKLTGAWPRDMVGWWVVSVKQRVAFGLKGFFFFLTISIPVSDV